MDKWTAIVLSALVIAFCSSIAAMAYFDAEQNAAVGVECVKRPDREWIDDKCVVAGSGEK